MENKTAFQIDLKDNVATALAELTAGDAAMSRRLPPWSRASCATAPAENGTRRWSARVWRRSCPTG